MASPIDVGALFSLAGKTAIVTGGTGGLGLAMTIALASAGADIISIEHPDDDQSANLKDAVERCGRKYHQYVCDLREAKDLRAVFENIWFDELTADILLNCAGIQRRAEAVAITDEDIDAVLDVNVKATIVACQEFARPLLRDRRPGKIINVASIIAFIGAKNIMPYAASKGAVLQATKALSNEWTEKGIQCNCISPGYFRTPLTEQYSTDPQYKEFDAYVMSRTPARRWGQPRDLSGAVIFLASAASDYVSGTSIACDGGFLGM